ncbi:MAG: RNA degradosome polyphosphate kinase [Clostridia bacterium]|nr:RNA degradosome polyphosphate kinase [Clostridia bacterium]
MKNQKQLFTNRELSWLDFNYRVLQEAEDNKIPLFERLKFLAITASNLDEFFMVRIAGLKQQVDYGVTRADIAGLLPEEQLEQANKKTHEFMKAQYACYRDLLNACNKEDIEIIRGKDLKDSEKAYVDKYYAEVIQPVLTPLAVDASRPFPNLANKKINIALSLKKIGTDETVHAIVQIPSILRRFIRIGESRRYILIEDAILMHIGNFFNGYEVGDAELFRITRNGDLFIDEDAQDLLLEIEKSLKNRRHGEPCRLEIMNGFSEGNIREDLLEFLKENLNVDQSDVFRVDGPLDLTYLFPFTDLNEYNQYKYGSDPPQESLCFRQDENMFDTIKEKDILLHHPYESFQPVIDIVEKAAADERVLAIKQTLYRVSGNSPIVSALIRAAQMGKQVTVLVELKARFDEENNIAWAKRLEDAGCHVIYGLLGLKVHCKALLIVRREEDGIRRYVHLGTGNYNDSTAKIYTDFGLFTAKPAITADVSALFNVLTGFSVPAQYKKLFIAPTGLRKFFIDMIDKEIEKARNMLPSGITAKVNALIDEEIIEKLYEASQAGVKIRLLIRGINGLRSKVKGLSENIEVMSIVGRYLEHHRIYIFTSGGENKVYLASADWMPRNLDRRVEVLFPIEQDDIRHSVIEAMELMLSDNVKMRVQQSDGTYRKMASRGKKINSQESFFKQYRNAARRSLMAPDVIFKPKTKP